MKIKILSYLLFVAIFSTTSCKKKSNLELYLIDKQKKWVYINNEKYDRESMRYGSYVKFNGDGSCQSLSIVDDTPPFDIHNSNNDGNWKYDEKDSSLNVYDHEFKVLKIQEDTISVLRKKDNWKALFINNFREIGNKRKINR